MAKARLDVVVKEQLNTRSKAQDAIKEGRVLVNGKVQTKPSFQIEETDTIQILDKEDDYVSRAGGKLQTVFDAYDIDISNQVVLDVGASTGGFTDVCLRHHAKKVYALDVGHLQLASVLDNDPRVIKMEGYNARHMEPSWFYDPIDFLCMDVSFISCKTILDVIFKKFEIPHFVCLIKPQFECGPQALNKHGVLKNPKLQDQIVEDIKQMCFQYYAFVRVVPSKVVGRTGNQEFLLYAKDRR